MVSPLLNGLYREEQHKCSKGDIVDNRLDFKISRAQIVKRTDQIEKSKHLHQIRTERAGSGHGNDIADPAHNISYKKNGERQHSRDHDALRQRRDKKSDRHGKRSVQKEAKK